MAYTEERKDKCFNEILLRIREGETVRGILRDKSLPSTETFFKWLDNDEIKTKRYVRAINTRTHAKFESIESDYSEEPQRDKETGKIDTGWVQLQRLKIDAKKWELSKLMPKKYGDKVQTENVNKNFDLSNLSDEEFQAQLDKANKVLNG